jgi:hypothetical protein
VRRPADNLVLIGKQPAVRQSGAECPRVQARHHQVEFITLELQPQAGRDVLHQRQIDAGRALAQAQHRSGDQRRGGHRHRADAHPARTA